MPDNKDVEMKYVTNGWFIFSLLIIGSLLGTIFGITQTKVSQVEYDKFEDRQCKVNDKYENALKENTKVLTEVKTILQERKDKQ